MSLSDADLLAETNGSSDGVGGLDLFASHGEAQDEAASASVEDHNTHACHLDMEGLSFSDIFGSDSDLDNISDMEERDIFGSDSDDDAKLTDADYFPYELLTRLPVAVALTCLTFAGPSKWWRIQQWSTVTAPNLHRLHRLPVVFFQRDQDGAGWQCRLCCCSWNCCFACRTHEAHADLIVSRSPALKARTPSTT